MAEQAQQNSPSFWQRLGGLLQHELATTVFQLAKGAAFVLAASFGGVAAALGTGAALIAIGLYKTQLDKNHQRRELLHLYREDIAALTGKPVNALTIADLEAVAQQSPSDQKNAIGRELETLEQNSRHQMTVGMISTVAMALGSAAIIGTGLISTTALKSWYAGAVASGISKAIHFAADLGLASHTGGRREYSVNREIAGLRRQLANDYVTPERVFAVFVEANPALRQDIRQRHGDSYQNLSIGTKRQIMDALHPRPPVEALTDAINKDRIRPTALGFLAYGHPAPAAKPLEVPAATPAATGGAEPSRDSEFGKRVLSERNAPPAPRVLH